MDRPRRLTPKKNDTGEMIGLLPEEEAALRKALLASMQSEKTVKKPSSLPPSKRGSKRGGRWGKGRCKLTHGLREQRGRLEDFETRCESRPAEEAQFSSSSPFNEPDATSLSQGLPDQSSSDSDSNFSAEEMVSWTPDKKELSSYSQIHLQESASIESDDLSSCNDHETLDFQLSLSQSDSTTPNEVSSPLPSDSSKPCYQNLDNKLTTGCLYHTQKNVSQCLPQTLHKLGKRSQNDNVFRTEDFVSFLCMRNDNERLPAGLLQLIK